MDRFLYGYLIPFAVAFLLVAVGMYFVLESVPLLLDLVNGAPVALQPETASDQQVFKDVLQTVLAVAALAIAAFGYGTYKILSSQIEDKVIANTESRYQKSLAYQRVSLAYAYWLLYENSDNEGTAKAYLDKAIEHTRRAYDEQVVLLNANAPEVERLICQIRNNLAYYISERHVKVAHVDSATQAESLSLVKWLEGRVGGHVKMCVNVIRRRPSPVPIL